MNRRSFLKLLPLLPVAAKAVATAAPAYEIGADFAAGSDCMGMSYYVAHPAQIAAYQRALALEVESARALMFGHLKIIATPACEPDKVYLFNDLSPETKGHWRAAWPT